tara:strand:+ start:431 stop:964 length:534 start_codon:yes stop_codon:yes gene_type:complete
VIKLDILEKQVKPTYLAVGSNLGNKLSNIEEAKNQLLINDIIITDSSSYYRSPSWPNANFPDFLNIVLKIKTKNSLKSLFTIIKKIEKNIGRKNSPKNYPRVCDIDIIDFKGLNQKIVSEGEYIEIPHPRMQNRNFVIFPLFELDKTWTHPKTKIKISSIIKQFNNKDFSDIRIVNI